MRYQKEQKSRKEIPYESKSLKDGYFTKEELSQYGLSDDEIAVILDYQALLPVLQENEENWISAKLLHNQLKVGRDFSEWIKKQIDDMELSESTDYKTETLRRGINENMVVTTDLLIIF